MKFEFSVIFTYDIRDRNTHTGESSSFNTIDDLKLVIQNGLDYYKMPYTLNVTRAVQIVDTDLPNKNENDIISMSYVQPHPHILARDGFDFIVADKLIYPKDVRTILKNKYGNTIDFDTNRKWDEKQPVFLDGVIENTRYGLRDSNTGAPTQYTIRSVVCYPLTDKHIVINKNLSQIYPEKTGKIPTVLTELLSKNAIEIIQR